MIIIQSFPFSQVKKGSKVILYGAGQNGLKLWEQVTVTKWCDILAIVDQRYTQIKQFPIEVQSPEILRGRNDYDYVIVTIAMKTVAVPAMEYISSLEVSDDKIISVYNEYSYIPEKINFDTKEESAESLASDKLKILLHPQGAMGDFVISLKVYEELVKLAPNCIIDIWGDEQWFVPHVFFDLPNLGKVIEKAPDDWEWKDCDIVIDLRFVPHIISANYQKIMRLAPLFAERILKLKENDDTDFVDLHVYQYANRILLDRARFLGLNRYTMFGISGIFDIRDQRVKLNIRKEAEVRFNEMKLDKPYITFNYGANNVLKDGKPQTKMWLLEYHEMLNKMLKKAYPDIEIIQLGSADVKLIDGADRYILGEDIETVKYILKSALFHFDCEGGLVHIATQLGTKCFVVFGPTPEWFLGYTENTNIVSDVCNECKGLIPDWYTRCYRGYKPAACMASIKPVKVFGLMKEYLDNNLV